MLPMSSGLEHSADSFEKAFYGLSHIYAILP